MWKVDFHATQTHVWPLDDLREHYMGFECWCNPPVDAEEPTLVIHNSGQD